MGRKMGAQRGGSVMGDVEVDGRISRMVGIGGRAAQPKVGLFYFPDHHAKGQFRVKCIKL